jgi:DNA mismatch repair ATPase MutS
MRSHSHIQNSSKIIDINRGKIQKSYNTIFAFLDRCRTTFGKRKLKLWLLNPLIDINEIQERQLCIEWILKKGVYSTRYSDSWSKKVSDLLGDMPDLERFLTSLHNHKISPKSFINLLQSVIKLEQLHIICNTNR